MCPAGFDPQAEPDNSVKPTTLTTASGEEVRLSDGKTMNLKTACLIPIPGGDDGGGGGGMPGFGGAGIPNMEAMMQSLPPWLREKLARGETPTFDDLKRLVGVEASTTELGVLIVMCLGLLWKLGLMRGLIVDASVG